MNGPSASVRPSMGLLLGKIALQLWSNRYRFWALTAVVTRRRSSQAADEPFLLPICYF